MSSIDYHYDKKYPSTWDKKYSTGYRKVERQKKHGVEFCC